MIIVSDKNLRYQVAMIVVGAEYCVIDTQSQPTPETVTHGGHPVIKVFSSDYPALALVNKLNKK